MHRLLPLVSFLLLLCSCVNNPAEVNTLTEKDRGPQQTAHNIEILYSDSAQLKVRVVTPLLQKFSGEDPYILFPNGVKAYFYDENRKVNSSLTAKYAVNRENEKLMEAKKDVQVVNNKGEKLNTEHLVWDQKNQKLFSSDFVKITTAEEVIYGDGFEANEDFTKYRIKKIKGIINLKE
jgi:LPS export ABC transporter protein LptC